MRMVVALRRLNACVGDSEAEQPPPGSATRVGEESHAPRGGASTSSTVSASHVHCRSLAVETSPPGPIRAAKPGEARRAGRLAGPSAAKEYTLSPHKSSRVPERSALPLSIMASVSSKIYRTANAPGGAPSEIETVVAQALLDLESNVTDLKTELRSLQFSAAKEIDVKGGKKAIVIFVPVPQLKAFHKIQQRLTRELEKKFSDRHVLFIGQRRILPKPGHRSRVKQPRPRSRTLTSVHASILEDLVYPTEITGKRVRVATDGGKLIKCFLDSKDATSLEYKLDSFSSVYRKLTGKDVTFMFRDADGI